ncbi:pyridoxamine 5'-phosphate oxidase family protein [Variovorax fucosicus]|uniref:pyridoxamine 5'-phosphate oxidase family protein n=1 Tax=Variovorax fucosicus TaxID=3053517 RepID=UPI0025776624|nr:pyridoxamine 5'-phosphate oxidase family protein [Variovorax sp. J22G47]MDM0058486.1 pyridoxamine 5'-phosphate oxidase family protein [Variovorax sp. J22G47]
MTSYTQTEQTRVRRRLERGSYDRKLVHAIIDEAIVCHVAFVVDGSPRVIPTTILRIEEDVYLHGSPTNRLLNTLAEGAPASIAVTHIDGIVAGRSGFGCSVDYRSVVIFASGEKVEGLEKEPIMDAVIQTVIPGHRVRRPTRQEMEATMILRFPLNEVSAKVRDVGVRDIETDYELDLWAGVIPLKMMAVGVRDDVRLKPGIATPEYASGYRR